MNTDRRLDNIQIVLSHTTHPGNIGATARAMKTMGLHNLSLVNPKHFPDPDADARASGAMDVLQAAKRVDTLDEALQGAVLAVALTARRRDLSHRHVDVREAANELMQAAGQGLVAVLFGTEMSGLSNAELDKCQLLASIPANPDYSSLNLAAAVQVVCYELRMACTPNSLNTVNQRIPATLNEIELFYRHLEQTLVETGFLDPAQPKRLMQRLRRLFARSQLEKEEVNILRGILTSLDKYRR